MVIQTKPIRESSIFFLIPIISLFSIRDLGINTKSHLKAKRVDHIQGNM